MGDVMDKFIDMAITAMVGVALKKVSRKQKLQFIKMMCEKFGMPMPFNIDIPEEKPDAG